MANTNPPTTTPRQHFEDGNGLAYAFEAFVDFNEWIAVTEHSRAEHGPQLLGRPTRIETCQVATCVAWREADRRWRRFMAGILP